MFEIFHEYCKNTYSAHEKPVLNYMPLQMEYTIKRKSQKNHVYTDETDFRYDLIQHHRIDRVPPILNAMIWKLVIWRQHGVRPCLCAAPPFRPVLTLYTISETPELVYRSQKTPGPQTLDLHFQCLDTSSLLEL